MPTASDVEFAAQDSMSRVAARIVELSDGFGKPDGDAIRIDLPISQEELAGWTGCSRDSVVKALQAMRGLGWIETQRRRITVLDDRCAAAARLRVAPVAAVKKKPHAH